MATLPSKKVWVIREGKTGEVVDILASLHEVISFLEKGAMPGAHYRVDTALVWDIKKEQKGLIH